MNALSFFALYPLIYLVAVSPTWLMYRISNGLYFIIYHLIGYRRKVVSQNLKNAFPEKSMKEIAEIESRFFQYLCDLVLETLKTTKWNDTMVRNHLSMEEVPVLNELYQEGKSFIIVMGHFGNWEWAGPCFSLSSKHQLVVIYQPLSNPYFEKMLVRSRTKFNTRIVPRVNTLKSMIKDRDKVNATALIADQAPIPLENALWIDFLNQDTPVFTGPEKIARKLNQPVIYMRVSRTARGKYKITPVLINREPKDSEPNEITKEFNRLLEEDIRRQPETWLWSHKRWKHKRPVDKEVQFA